MTLPRALALGVETGDPVVLTTELLDGQPVKLALADTDDAPVRDAGTLTEMEAVALTEPLPPDDALGVPQADTVAVAHALLVGDPLPERDATRLALAPPDAEPVT